MNSTKISIGVVIASFIIGGGFVAAANLPIGRGGGGSSADTSAESSSVVISDDTSADSSDSDSSESSKPDDSSSQPSSSSNALIRDENGVELPYDVMPIVEAYRTGDSSQLSDKDKAALKAAADVINTIITDDMSDYDKERTIHNYIALNNSYNDSILSVLGTSILDDSSPYGMLVKHKTVCKGYATTFKLLCNMCDIECELIVEYEGKDIHHAYNRALIGGSWYYVDVTWDDDDSFVTSEANMNYKYFNLTKAQMAYNHDLSSDCPDTVSDEYTYAAQNIVTVKSYDELADILSQLKVSGTTCPIYVKPVGFKDIKLTYDKRSDAFDYYFDSGELSDRFYDVLYESGTDPSVAKTVINGEVVLRIEPMNR